MFISCQPSSGSILNDVPGGSNSSEMSNELNETSDTLVSISTEGKSLVWAYFGYEANSSEVKEGKGLDIVICYFCKKPVVKKGGNTSNMLSHLKVHHPLQHNEARAAAVKSMCNKQGQKKSSFKSFHQVHADYYTASFKAKVQVRNGSCLLTL